MPWSDIIQAGFFRHFFLKKLQDHFDFGMRALKWEAYSPRLGMSENGVYPQL